MSSRRAPATIQRATLFPRRFLMALVAAAALAGSYPAVVWFDRGVLRYPIALSQVQQYETQGGYVLHLKIRSTTGSTIYVPRRDLDVRLSLDDAVVATLSAGQGNSLVKGATAQAFDSKVTLDAAIQGRTYANVASYIAVVSQPRDLFLLITVSGPGSPNPSARFLLGRVYRSLTVTIRKVGLRRPYLDVPIPHVPVVGDDEATRVLER